MISSKMFSARVTEAKKEIDVSELPDDVLQMSVGGGDTSTTNDFHDVYNDNYSDGPIIGPTFIDVFSETLPPQPKK
jgi:hypothetical protein